MCVHSIDRGTLVHMHAAMTLAGAGAWGPGRDACVLAGVGASGCRGVDSSVMLLCVSARVCVIVGIWRMLGRRVLGFACAAEASFGLADLLQSAGLWPFVPGGAQVPLGSCFRGCVWR